MRLHRPLVAFAVAALAAAVVAGPEALAQGCAMCGSALAGDDRLGRAFSISILFLMATPYTIAAVVGGCLIYMYRRASGQRGAAVIDLARAARFLRRRRPAENPEGEVS